LSYAGGLRETHICEKRMKVNLVCHGRFLSFEIARELKKRGAAGVPYLGTRLLASWISAAEHGLMTLFAQRQLARDGAENALYSKRVA